MAWKTKIHVLNVGQGDCQIITGQTRLKINTLNLLVRVENFKKNNGEDDVFGKDVSSSEFSFRKLVSRTENSSRYIRQLAEQNFKCGYPTIIETWEAINKNRVQKETKNNTFNN